MKKIIAKYLPKIIGFQLNSLYLVNPQQAVKKSYALFCSPRCGKVLPEQEAFLTQARLEQVNIEGKTLQTYHWKGSGKTILLVHGWESNTHRWKALIEKLQQKNYNIYAFDAPAHGNSTGKIIHVPLYGTCLHHIVKRYSPSVLIGHSMGAMTTVFQQHKYHNPTIEKMVLLGPPSELTAIVNDFQKILQLKPKLIQALEDYFKQSLGYRFYEFSIATFAKNIQQKGLIIHDIYDKIAPISASEAIHQNWQDSRLVKTEGAGHSLNNEYIHNVILEFLKH